MNSHRRLAAGVMILMLLLAAGASAQSVYLEHTYKLDEEGTQPAAVLEDVRWLARSWAGTAFGGTFEEVWNPPSAGTMVGMFKVLNDDEIHVYLALHNSDKVWEEQLIYRRSES